MLIPFMDIKFGLATKYMKEYISNILMVNIIEYGILSFVKMNPTLEICSMFLLKLITKREKAN